MNVPDKDIEPTPDEARAIRRLKALARDWPDTLWLYSAGGALHVMRKGDDGVHVTLPHDGIDPDYSLATVEIENSGGDW